MCQFALSKKSIFSCWKKAPFGLSPHQKKMVCPLLIKSIFTTSEKYLESDEPRQVSEVLLFQKLKLVNVAEAKTSIYPNNSFAFADNTVFRWPTLGCGYEKCNESHDVLTDLF